MPNAEMLGIVLALLGGILDNVGVSLQKLSLSVVDQHHDLHWANPRWVSGICLYLIGTVLNGIGLGLAPASLVALLAPFVLVYNVINSILVLNERLTRRILAGTVVIIVASSIAIGTGSRSREPDLFRVDDFVAHLLTPAFLIYSFCLTAFMVRFAGCRYLPSK